MDTMQENVEDLVGHLTDYVETQKELILINAQEKAAAILAESIGWIITGLFAFFAFIFLSTALALCLGKMLESNTQGFLVVGVFYSIIGTTFFLLRKSLLQDTLSQNFLNKFTGTNG